MATPSWKKIAVHLGCDQEQARLARALMVVGERGGDDASKAMDSLAKWFEFHGVECIRGEEDWDSYYGDNVATYLNAGDSYAATIVYETRNKRFVLTTMGDWVEKNEKRYKIR